MLRNAEENGLITSQVYGFAQSIYDRIVCPSCSAIQHSWIEFYPLVAHADFTHDCQNCDYMITESEWNSTLDIWRDDMKKVGWIEENDGSYIHKIKIGNQKITMPKSQVIYWQKLYRVPVIGRLVF